MLLNNRILNGIEIKVAKINLNKANIKMKNIFDLCKFDL